MLRPTQLLVVLGGGGSASHFLTFTITKGLYNSLALIELDPFCVRFGLVLIRYFLSVLGLTNYSIYSIRLFAFVLQTHPHCGVVDCTANTYDYSATQLYNY